MKNFYLLLLVLYFPSLGFAQAPDFDLSERIPETPPILKQCQKETSSEGLKKCLSRNIQKIIQSKINFKKIAPELNPGKNYIYIDFAITEDKKVERVLMNFPDGDLSDFFKKNLKKLKFKEPAKTKSGKPLNIKFTVPMVLDNNEYLNKPTPVYESSKLQLANLSLEELTWAPRYYYTKTDIKGKPDEDKKAVFNKTKQRFISGIYNHINIYKIGGYLNEGMNIFPIEFTIEADGTMTNLIAKTDSEHLNNYLETLLQSLPKISVPLEDGKSLNTDFKLELAYSLKTKK